MCTLMYSVDKNNLSLLLKHLRDRSRDAFGCVFENGNKITSTDFSSFVIDVLNTDSSSYFLYGRAIPESEPDYLTGGSDEAIQPIKIENIPSIVFGFHGLINKINGKKIADEIVDTLELYHFISDVFGVTPTRGIAHEESRDIFETLFDNIKGSYLLFVKRHVVGFELFVITNFLSCFYNPTKKYISSVPICPDEEVRLEPYSCYCFESRTLELQSSYKWMPSHKSFGVIGSGGLDSSTVLALNKMWFNTKDNIHVFHFSYGQDSDKEELAAVERLCDAYNANLHVVDAKRIFEMCDYGSLLLQKNTKDTGIDTLTDMERDVHYVSMRNSILGIISASLCEQKDITHLSLGVNLTEGLVYTDNGNRWFYAMKDLLKTAGRKPIQLTAPLLNLLKHEIIKLGELCGARYDLTMSCYHPQNGKACGVCGSCMNRIRAFARNGFRDAVEYVEYPPDFMNLPIYKPNPNMNKLVKFINKYHIEV